MRLLIALAALLAPAQAFAQHESHDRPDMAMQADPHAGHDMDQDVEETADPHAGHAMATGEEPAILDGPPPREAFSGPDHAADTVFGPEAMAASRDALQGELGGMTARLVMVDRIEAQAAEGEETYLWDANLWFGGDIDKLWLKTEGEGEFGGELEEAELQALWSHAIGPYFDLQAGVRYDVRPEPDRAHAVIGIQGLAPYFFEIDAAAFLSTEGDLTARIEAEYDQRLTQRLIIQPRIELNLAAQDIPEHGVGSGLSSLEAGLRLRYEIVPEFAPYIGAEWQRDFGDTADYTRAGRGDPDRIVFLAGVRLWF